MVVDERGQMNERPIEKVETRRFHVDIIERDARDEPRLRLLGNEEGQGRVEMAVPSADMLAVRKELFDRGYRGGYACDCARGRPGTWRSYLNELEMIHIIVEMLGWELSDAAAGVVKAVDDYGRTAPRGMSSPRLR